MTIWNYRYVICRVHLCVMCYVVMYHVATVSVECTISTYLYNDQRQYGTIGMLYVGFIYV